MANLGDLNAERSRSNRSISIHITAEDGADLRRQLLNLLGMYATDAGTTPYLPQDWTVAEPDVKPATEEAVQRVEPEEAPKAARRAHRRTRPPVAPPEPVEEPVEEEAADEQPETAANDDLDEAVLGIDASTKALANERLKTETIARLQDLFTEGKVKVIRHVLSKYGNGAKSFPEIDAGMFPAIKAALQRGEEA